MDDKKDTTSHATTDRETIQNWAEDRDAKPASVVGTGEGDDPGILRLDFPEEEADENLQEISWDRFFRKFDEKNLAFVYQEAKASGEESWFGKLVDRDSAMAREARATDTEAEPEMMDAPAETETADESELADTMDEQQGLAMRGGETTDAEPPTMDDDAMAHEDEPVAHESEEGMDEGETMRETEATYDDETEMGAGADEVTRSTADEIIEEALRIDEIHENAFGPDGWNKNDEFLVFRNDGSERLDLSGWTVTSEEGHTYRFPEDYSLGSDEQVTLFTGDGDDTDLELYWKSDEPVWKNEGDTVTVKDAEGREVLRESYD